MKRIASVVAGLSLFAVGARADEPKDMNNKDEAKVESHHDKDGTFKHKKTMKAKQGDRTDEMTEEHKMDKDIGGGTTETKEMKNDHDMGHMRHHKMEKKETIKRDKDGNVVEKKEEAK